MKATFFFRLYKGLGSISLIGSSFIVLLMAYDRFEAVKDPLKHHNERTKRSLHTRVAIAWFLALLCATPQVKLSQT